MNDRTLTQILTAARRPGILTEKELQAFEPYARGLSERSIAGALGITRSSVRDRLERAIPKVQRALRSTEAVSVELEEGSP